ncbi:MAG: hypothetical protein RL308_2617 [Bacteroidota bacterium]|jgi:hypothetical protein
MTAKEKAVEIYNRYYFRLKNKDEISMNLNAKMFAFIAVDLILSLNKVETEYWQDVKNEIQKL